jgi:hypothetical protein
MYVTNIDNGEYIRLRGVDFGSVGAKQFTLSAAATGSCTVTLRLDSADGPVIGVSTVKPSGNLDKYKSFGTKVKNASGVHDLYICFDNASGDVRLDWWTFKK